MTPHDRASQRLSAWGCPQCGAPKLAALYEPGCSWAQCSACGWESVGVPDEELDDLVALVRPLQTKREFEHARKHR